MLVFLTGIIAWPNGVFLKYTSGDQLGPVNLVSVKSLSAGEFYDLSVNMISPAKTGMYQGQWRMCTPSGQYFGGKQIYCQTSPSAILVTSPINCFFSFLGFFFLFFFLS